jgi:hypothetical protein
MNDKPQDSPDASGTSGASKPSMGRPGTEVLESTDSTRN